MTTCLILLAGFALVVLGAVLLALAKPAIGLPEPKRVIHTAHRDRQPPGIVGLALFTALETLEITRAALRDRELRPHGIKLQAFLHPSPPARPDPLQSHGAIRVSPTDG